MIIKCFAIQDIKAGFFMQPFFCLSAGQAVRACMDLASEPTSTLARHPADFALYEIGDFDDASGTLHSHGKFLHLGNGTSFLPKPPAAVPLFSEEVN